jgi:peptidoglycan/LPS O-acetylase OafA/YrhL
VLKQLSYGVTPQVDLRLIQWSRWCLPFAIMQSSLRSARIPSLDGLRAISIGMVMFSHLAGTHASPVSLATASNWIDWGNLGVRVFFVISGFLISGLLFREEERTGTISLRDFYWRRTLRIFPAYFVFLLAIGAAAVAGLVTLGQHDWLHALTYTMNYGRSGRTWPLGHTWSLAVEEQFYLIWPALLLMAGRRRALHAAAVFVVVSCVLRVLVHVPHTPLFQWFAAQEGNSFETVGDAIAVGCLLAALRDRLYSDARWRRALASPFFVAVPAAVMLLDCFRSPVLRDRFGHHVFFWGLYLVIAVPMMNIGIALCVEWAIRHAYSRVGRMLNARPLVYVGTLSYSLYLWQQPFLNREQIATWTAFPANLLLALGCALGSFYLIERPVLRLRERVASGQRGLGPSPTQAAVT